MTGYTLTILEAGSETLRGQVIFDPAFIGFAGHFPDNRGGAILPAFCQVQIAVEILATATGGPWELHEVNTGKFLRAIRPSEALVVEMQRAGAAWQVTLHAGPELCSHFQLRLRH